MASVKSRYSKKEIARRGDELYEKNVRPHLSPKDDGMICAIDVDTGAYELDREALAACHRLRERVPDAHIWILRVGTRYVHRFGSAPVSAQ